MINFHDIKRNMQKRLSESLVGKDDHKDHGPTTTDYESDDELGNLSRSDRLKMQNELKASDSIKRAIVDLHRRSKLLTNFAIMNTTGFIKIIKNPISVLSDCFSPS